MPQIKKMNKKVVIGGGIVALAIGAIAGLYIYTKKTIGKIAAAIDDTFDIEDDYIYEQRDEEINGQKIHMESIYPKDEKKRTMMTVDLRLNDADITQLINKMKKQLDKKCEDCPCKNKNQSAYPAWWETYPPYGREAEGITWAGNIDDKLYKDYINTINMFDGDEK